MVAPKAFECPRKERLGASSWRPMGKVYGGLNFHSLETLLKDLNICLLITEFSLCHLREIILYWEEIRGRNNLKETYLKCLSWCCFQCLSERPGLVAVQYLQSPAVPQAFTALFHWDSRKTFRPLRFMSHILWIFSLTVERAGAAAHLEMITLSALGHPVLDNNIWLLINKHHVEPLVRN